MDIDLVKFLCPRSCTALIPVSRMTTSQKYHDWISQQAKLSDCRADMDWQTPAISEKFQSRFGRWPSTSDSGDTGLGTTPSDSTEDFCSSSGSPSFQPIRSQIAIPTAHVMPSTASAPAPKPQPRAADEPQASAEASSGSRDSSASSSKSSPLPKSASSPNLEAHGHGDADAPYTKMDCLSRYRSLVNGLDHSLFPPGEHSRLGEGQRFEMPAVEPTLNQSALLGTFCPDPRFRLQMSGLGDTPEPGNEVPRGSLDPAYKALPEAKLAVPGASDPYGPRTAFPPAHIGGAGFSTPHTLQTHAWLREQPGAKGYEPRPLERPCDLASWQQQQKQLESLRLQVEQMQLLTAGSGQYSSLYPSSLHTDGNAWDAVVKASESLLKEKELIIERQRQQMSQLEQRLHESELQVHGALLGRGGPPYTDVCLLRLQEAQRENTFLRAQFAERTDSFAKEKAESERRLAVEETEVQRLKEALQEASQKHSEELKKQEERIRSRDKHINSLKKKCQKESEQSRERQQRIETLERYLADLPTMEDYQSQSKQLEQAEEKAKQLQESVSELEARLGETRAATREREAQLEEQRQRERDLLSTVTSLQERVQEGLADGARLPSVDMEKLRGENAALREELQRLKKVIEKQQRMMEQLKSQIRVLEEQALQEEGSSQALREELSGKEKGLLQLRGAMKELSAQNQELMEQNLTLQERLGDSGRGAPPAPAGAQLTQRLHGEMAACLSDLRSLCNVLTQRAQGRDPNLSLLLGITSPLAGGEQQEDWQSPETLDRKLSEVRQLRRDVEELRTTVSDRYAQDMGDNCITQ
ncbi:centrosomal protein of 85 kDa [Megalops cyprinoides]|uniref:centrosomal protein of 85 kDa n=1 Tax=Megalops cyprinoides TaxID=118141 RepID=UPI001864EDB3|nr:centrosomal protein of 85 kDa [Megalops cyprinoides]